VVNTLRCPRQCLALPAGTLSVGVCQQTAHSHGLHWNPYPDGMKLYNTSGEATGDEATTTEEA
jgi:hypothetical protein